MYPPLFANFKLNFAKALSTVKVSKNLFNVEIRKGYVTLVHIIYSGRVKSQVKPKKNQGKRAEDTQKALENQPVFNSQCFLWQQVTRLTTR